MRVLKIILIIIIASQFFIVLSCQTAEAQVNFKPSVSIGPFSQGTEYSIDSNSIGRYVMAYYNYSVGIVGILSVVVMMIGGVIWITAGGSSERIGSAKSWIAASLTGLLLTLCSYAILNTINPDLLKFKPINVKQVDAVPTELTSVCDSAHVGENASCKETCSTEEEGWDNYKCPVSGQRCCLPKGSAGKIKCGSTTNVTTMCRPLSAEQGCGPGESPYLANCGTGQTCCAKSSNTSGYCGTDKKGTCFVKLVPLPCATIPCPSGYKGYTPDNCTSGMCCCIAN